MTLSKELIDEALNPSPWDFGNSVLYALCEEHPLHKDTGEVIAKIWIIGRSYAAAIERRRNKNKSINDDFYADEVAPKIIDSSIDEWIATSQKEKTFDSMLETHHNTTVLFHEISKLEKRSLASKYLHFHAKDLFYIFDSRAKRAISLLSKYTGRASKTTGKYDNDYRIFSEKCQKLQTYIIKQYNVTLTPRQMDKLLLLIATRQGF